MSKQKLLLADDSITIQKVVNLTFADEGIEVVTAGDGDAAMQKFVEIKPDLVMVDVNMPGMDGYRICELIKEDAETKHIPVILMVGSFEPFDEEEARRVGADDYLTKPFQSIRQLVNKVSLLLDTNAQKKSGSEMNFPALNYEGKPEEQTFEHSPAGNFGDVGLDDGMIQTDQIGSLPVNEEQKFESNSYADSPFFELPQMTLKKPYEFEVKNSIEEDISKTQPLTTAELEKITSSAANIEKKSDSADRPSFSKRYIIEESKIPEKKPEQNQNNSESPFADKNQPAPYEEKRNTHSTSRPTEILNFDDFNLLELPMFEDEEVLSEVEQKSPTNFNEYLPNPMLEMLMKMPETSGTEFEAATETPETVKISQEMPPPIPPSVEISQNTSENEPETVKSTAQTIDFTPDLIEAIAAKVAEKISKIAVREIVSEITPQMVEMIMKQMAEEKNK